MRVLFQNTGTTIQMLNLDVNCYFFLHYINADLNLELSAHALSLLSLGSCGKSLRYLILTVHANPRS